MILQCMMSYDTYSGSTNNDDAFHSKPSLPCQAAEQLRVYRRSSRMQGAGVTGSGMLRVTSTLHPSNRLLAFKLPGTPMP